MNDLKFAFRQLLKNPGFTAVAVLTLALGIGANTAVFSVINATLLRPFPYENPERLIILQERNAGRGGCKMLRMATLRIGARANRSNPWRRSATERADWGSRNGSGNRS